MTAIIIIAFYNTKLTGTWYSLLASLWIIIEFIAGDYGHIVDQKDSGSAI